MNIFCFVRIYFFSIFTKLYLYDPDKFDLWIRLLEHWMSDNFPEKRHGEKRLNIEEMQKIGPD